jgi:NADH-quinone oxidoreductase subunit C
MKLEALQENIKKDFPEIKIDKKNEQYLQLQISERDMIPFLRKAKKMYGLIHLSAISCVDWIEENKFELSYHLWSYENKILVDANVKIDREKAEFDTVIDIYHPAKFYERDIFEFFGVRFKGNNDMRKFILTDWDGIPPLRREFVTREYALDRFVWKEYHPEWAKKFGLTAEQLNNYRYEVVQDEREKAKQAEKNNQ